MPDQLQISLSAAQERFLVGESLVFTLSHNVTSALDMETVELNRYRTRIRLTKASETGPHTVEFSGADYIRLHKIHPLSGIGISFHAPAGSSWTSPLDLLNYTSPLEPGSYRVELSYRYGDTEQETVQTNAVYFEVVPAKLLGCRYRWFGTGVPHHQLGCLWTAREEDRTHWFYQASDKTSPAGIEFATRVLTPDFSIETPPRLAHINDIADMHFLRYVAWTEPGMLGWLTVHREGVFGEPQRMDHDLRVAILAEPPLQRRDGGFNAVLVGRDSAVMAGIEPSGERRWRPMPVPGTPASAVVVWDDEENGEGWLFSAAHEATRIYASRLGEPWQVHELDAQAPVLQLAVQQWHGRGTILALTQDEHNLAVLAWDAHDPQLHTRRSYDLEKLELQRHDYVDAAAAAGSPDLAVLLRGPESWVVLSAQQRFELPRDKGTPRLVTYPDGLFLVYHDPNRGFQALRLGEPPPEPRI